MAVGLLVAVMQGALVFAMGTDLPWWDQWGVEGRWFYPSLVDGSLGWGQLWQAHNEHRIVWTHLLNLGLWQLNGQWDPSLQQMVGVVLRAAVAGWLTGRLGRGRRWFGLVVLVAFSPLAAWHNATWGFQSQVYFALGWGALAISGAVIFRGWKQGVFCGLTSLAAAWAMGPGVLVSWVWVGLLGWMMMVEREGGKGWLGLLGVGMWAALLWFSKGASLPAEGAQLGAASVGQIWDAVWLGLAWPHGTSVAAGLVIQAPLLGLVGLGFTRWRTQLTRRDAEVVGYGLWMVLIVGGMAVTRGGGTELQTGVPSRYVDFMVLSLLVNGVALVRVVGLVAEKWIRLGRVVAVVWGCFLLIGWVGLNAENWRGVVRPRMADREAPVRLLQAFQATGNHTIFAGAPKLYVPYPDLDQVQEVLMDARLRGRLPPSLQPSEGMGVGSRGVRAMRARSGWLAGGFLAVAIALGWWDDRLRRRCRARLANLGGA